MYWSIETGLGFFVLIPKLFYGMYVCFFFLFLTIFHLSSLDIYVLFYFFWRGKCVIFISPKKHRLFNFKLFCLYFLIFSRLTLQYLYRGFLKIYILVIILIFFVPDILFVIYLMFEIAIRYLSFFGFFLIKATYQIHK